MAEISKLKIKKQLYNFEVRKRFLYSKSYKIKELPPIEKIRRQFAKTFKRKEPAKAKLKPAGTRWAAYAFFALALLVLAGGALFLWLQSIQQTQSFLTRAFIEPDVHTELADSAVVSFGAKDDDENVAYLLVNERYRDVQELNISLLTYADNVPSEIFILRSAKDDSQTSSYPDFRSELKRQLSEKRISVNEMDLAQAEMLQKGAVLVVPSGYVPKQLLGIGSSSTITDLVKRGVVIVYIGYPFDHMIDDEQGLVISTPREVLGRLPFTFGGADQKMIPNSGFALEGPYYSAKGTGYDTFLIYGVVSVVKKGDGAVIFVPQSLDYGWNRDGNLAAEQIAKLLEEQAWISPDSVAPVIYNVNISQQNATAMALFTAPFKGDARYVKAEVSAVDLNGESLGELRAIRVRKKTNGNLYIQGGASVVSSDLTKSDVRLTADLKEENPGVQMLYLSFFKDGVETGDRILANPLPINLQIEAQILVPITLDTGAYLVNLVDKEGKKYAQAEMRMVFVDIERLPDEKEREVFRFAFKKDGNPVILDDVTVNIKSATGQDYGTYKLPRGSSATIDVSKNQFGETQLPFNNYKFSFTIGEVTKDVDVNLYAPENIFLSLPFLGVIGTAVVIILIGTWLARMDTVIYLLDIPDFPPVVRTKIPIKSDTVLGVFDQVNSDYRWKNVPLTVAELKNGFKKVFFGGKPIFISDYNMEFIMDKLIARKQMVRFLEYYAPAKWETETGRSIRYLGMFRRLRDTFVTNAVPFTMMGEMKNCDTKISLMGQEMFLHIYDRRGDMKKLVGNILSTAKDGISIVVFKDDGEKGDFKDLLSSATPAAAALKLEVETNSVQLLDAHELEEMIKEMKTI